MARFRVWLRAHVLTFLRDPDRKTRTQRPNRSTWTKSIVISAPVPLGSMLAFDMDVRHSLPRPRSFHDVAEPHPLRHSRYMSADQLVPPIIVEADEPSDDDHDERPLTPPPDYFPGTAVEMYGYRSGEEPDAALDAPARRPTRNFSRRFSSRFSVFSAHSVSSEASAEEKRLSRLSAVSALSKPELRDEWAEQRLSRRWSNRMSGALETYQTHTRNYTPMGVI